MLLLNSAKTITVDGVPVYPDHADPNQFWYLPSPVRIAVRDEDDRKAFTFIKYKPAVVEAGVKGGGFMMFDDFHGSLQWAMFMRGMNKIFPDRPVVDISEKDEILHVLYDLDERTQIPGIRMLYTGKTYEEDGYDPHWRGIYDDEGRVVVAICHNMDLGDAVEHSDTPQYPQEYSAIAMRTFLNYIIYSMTH